jgi:V/A-type H+-transporting ATPase subunit C
VTRALDDAAGENRDFFSTYALDAWLVALFSMPVAFRILKAAVKKALSEGRGEVALPGELDGLPERELVIKAVGDILQAFSTDSNPAVVDTTLDRLRQQVELRLAGASEFLAGYLGLHADIENLRTLLRVKTQEGVDKDWAAEMKAAFLDGGSLALVSLQAALQQPWDAAFDLLAKAPPYGAGSGEFREYLEQGRPARTGRRSFVQMERLGREAELRYLRQTRYATFGHEPLVTFFLLRENELRNLRLIYAAKLAGREVEETQDLVAYVE